MFDNWKALIPEDFAGNSRVWIYQCSRMLRLNEALQTESLLEDFVEHWNSHGAKVKGYANLLFGQFLVIMADETATGVSGCSTDSSVRVVKEMETLFGVSMFDRLTLAFVIKDKVEMLPMAQLKYAIEKGFITAETPYFNNLVQTKDDLLSKWIIPVKESWLASRLAITV
jgi:hypothetical protein